MKKLFSILILLFLFGCGYTSIYSNNKNIKFKITEINMNGDQYINNIIRNELIRYDSNETEKKFKININSNFDKNIIAKDKSGNATDLTLKVIVNAEILNLTTNEINTTNLSESFDIVKRQNNFEQLNYEKIIKKDLTKIILNKIMLELGK